MKFRTEIPPSRSPIEIAHDDPIICIGSCFSEHMGGRLERLKFPVHINPFGIVYNPFSVAQTLVRICSEKEFTEKDMVEKNGLWYSFAHHGRFSHPDKKAMLDGLNSTLAFSHQFLKKTNRLIVTLGTANVFSLRKTGEAVANCHKFPGDIFERRRMSVEEVVAVLSDIFQKLKNENPKLEIIATVSPVRHLRDGLLENQKSKATLLLGLEKLISELPYVHYFPSYELVLDDLRDYRFYEADMAHPNKLAVDYVWEHFTHAFFSEKTKSLTERIERLVTASEHRPIHSESEAHRVFLKKQMRILENMEQEFPGLDFEKERNIFSQ